jgi:hypothetical protein
MFFPVIPAVLPSVPLCWRLLNQDSVFLSVRFSLFNLMTLIKRGAQCKSQNSSLAPSLSSLRLPKYRPFPLYS